MMRMGSLMLALCLCGATLAQDAKPPTGEKPAAGKDPQALKILETADAATKKCTKVHYKAKSTASGPLAEFAPPAEGEVWLAGKTKDATAPFASVRVEGKLKSDSGERELVIGSDGDKYFALDKKNKKAHIDITPDVWGPSGNGLANLAMREFSHPTPFADELNGDVVELREKTKVGGEECDVIHIVYRQAQGEAVWYFSTKDHLPRRVDRVIQMQRGTKETLTVELTELTEDAKIPDDAFKAIAPEGFEKSDEPLQ